MLLVQALPSSRAALSLLGFCYYHMGHYESACRAYERLSQLCPAHTDYKLYYAQSLFKAGDCEEAGRVLDVIIDHQEQVLHLKAAIAYIADDMQECKRVIRQCKRNSAEALQGEGCLLFKDGKYRSGPDLSHPVWHTSPI
jgi:tetratricopeptide repeat protein 30